MAKPLYQGPVFSLPRGGELCIETPNGIAHEKGERPKNADVGARAGGRLMNRRDWGGNRTGE